MPPIRAIIPFHRFYAKRCFLALIEGLAKQMLILKDSSFQEMMVGGATFPDGLGASFSIGLNVPFPLMLAQ